MTIYYRKCFGLLLALSVASAQARVSAESTDSVVHQPMTETNVKLNEVVVTGLTGNQKLRQSPAPVSVVSHRQLESMPTSNIIDAVSRQPGVSQITTGGSISKPVIRGLGYNRVVVVKDGIRQEGQQWGDEHGVEIDAHTVHSAEILKGPASLMYGSDAMAGVLVFHGDPIPVRGTVTGQLSTGYQSNNGLIDYSLDNAGHLGHWSWNTRYSGKLAHAYRNKYDGYVYGSAYREQAFAQQVGYHHARGHSRLSFDYFHLTPGIVEGERDETTGQLSVPDGYNIKSYGKPMPYQQVHHYKAAWENLLYVGDGSFKALVAYQQNRRQEFEEEETPDVCGLDMQLHTVNYDLHYLSPENGGWKWAAGIGGMYQRSANRGTEYLIPAYRLFDYGLFVTASRTAGRISLSGGLRYDHRHLRSEELTEEGETRFTAFSRSFDGLTGSLGLTVDISPAFNVKANLSRGFRAPNVSELGSNGVHEGTARYEVGNPALKPENSWQADLGADYVSSVLTARLALFANRIGHYIFSQKMAGADGQEILIDGEPAYRFTSGDARIMGGEVSVDAHPIPHLHVSSSFSYVHSVQLHSDRDARYLPFTPAPRWLSDVKYEFLCGKRWVDNLYLQFTVDCNLRQNHYLAANGTETPTPSYTLMHLYAGADVKVKGRRAFSLYLALENIADRAYQSHLSRLKYTDVNSVTQRRGVYNMGRNFSVRLVVPFGG